MIKRVGETYSRTLHDHEAGCVDRGQFVEIGAPEIFPRPLQIAELARKDFQSAPPRHPFLPRQSDIPVRVAIEKRECLDDHGNGGMKPGAGGAQQVPLLPRPRMQRVPQQRQRNPCTAVDKDWLALSDHGSS